jgi:hypothetical protein
MPVCFFAYSALTDAAALLIVNPGNKQITALKDHKDKVKPVFLYYKVGLAL